MGLASFSNVATRTTVYYLKSFGPILFAQVFGKSVAALKDLFIASFFGLSVYVDTYFLYLAIPGYLVTIFAQPFFAIITPQLAREPEEFRTHVAAQYAVFLFKRLIFIPLCILTLSLMAWKLDYANVFSLGCLVMMSMILPFHIFYQSLISKLAIEKDFNKLGLVSIVYPLVSLCFLFLTFQVLKHWSLPVSFLFGYLVELGIGLVLLKVNFKLFFEKAFSVSSDFFKNYRQLAFAALFFGSATVVDNFMISLLSPVGSVSAFGFGIKVVALCLSMGSLLVNNIFFQELARKHLKDKEFFKFYSFRSLYILFTSMILCIVLILVSPLLIKLLFYRGEVNFEDYKSIHSVFLLYSLQIPFFLGGVYATKCLNVLGQNKAVLTTSILALFVNVILNYFLISLIGFKGVALSTSLVYLFSFLSLNCFIWIYRIKNEL